MSSEVQCGQRLALSGMDDRQNGTILRRRRRRGFPGAQLLSAVHQPDEQEHDQRHDQEVDQRLDEQPVVQRRRAGLLGLGQTGVGHAREADEQAAEVHPAEQQAERRHDDVVDQRADDLAERRPQDHRHGQVEHVPAQHEGLELLEHPDPSPDRSAGRPARCREDST